jgi:hypothetical protein
MHFVNNQPFTRFLQFRSFEMNVNGNAEAAENQDIL